MRGLDLQGIGRLEAIGTSFSLSHPDILGMHMHGKNDGESDKPFQTQTPTKFRERPNSHKSGSHLSVPGIL
jgi:hypothetical protein